MIDSKDKWLYEKLVEGTAKCTPDSRDFFKLWTKADPEKTEYDLDREMTAALHRQKAHDDLIAYVSNSRYLFLGHISVLRIYNKVASWCKTERMFKLRLGDRDSVYTHSYDINQLTNVLSHVIHPKVLSIIDSLKITPENYDRTRIRVRGALKMGVFNRGFDLVFSQEVPLKDVFNTLKIMHAFLSLIPLANSQRNKQYKFASIKNIGESYLIFPLIFRWFGNNVLTQDKVEENMQSLGLNKRDIVLIRKALVKLGVLAHDVNANTYCIYPDNKLKMTKYL